MPESAMAAPRVVQTIEEAEGVLRENGGRVTVSRRAILTVLFAAQGPLSTDEIAATATPTLDLPATYRNLDHLEHIGLVRHVHLGHGPGLYELATHDEREYGLCESCGTAFAFDPAKLQRVRVAIDRAVGIRPRFAHFPLVGLCRNCRD